MIRMIMMKVKTVVIEEMVVIIEFKRCGRLDSITSKQVKSSIIIRKKNNKEYI